METSPGENLRILEPNEGLLEIHDVAFTSLYSLTEIEIPSTVESFGISILLFSNEDLVVKGTADSLAEEIAKEIEVQYEETQ